MGDQTRMRIRHFVFVAGTDRPSLTGRGTEAEWLQHYKIESEDDDEVFVPWEPTFMENTIPPAEDPKAGDMLWMQIDYDVIACVVISRVVEDVIGGRLELWFKGSDIKTVKGLKALRLVSGPGAVGVDRWVQHIED
jgi:hypothetical protein